MEECIPMNKITLIIIAVVVALFVLGLGVYGHKKGWFSSKKKEDEKTSPKKES